MLGTLLHGDGEKQVREHFTITRCLTASSVRVWLQLTTQSASERPATLDGCGVPCLPHLLCQAGDVYWAVLVYLGDVSKDAAVGVLLRSRPAAAAADRPARRGAGANNYLGLSNHPRLRDAAHRALDEHGFGLSSVRCICGTQDAHRRLEAQLAAFHHQQAAILYPSCFDANAGLFEARPLPGSPCLSRAQSRRAGTAQERLLLTPCGQAAWCQLRVHGPGRSLSWGSDR